MKTPDAELPRRASWGAKAVGALVAAGVALAASSPAMADKWHNPGHNKHWKKHHHYEYSHGGYYYYPRPKVVYVQPAPVYVAPPPPVYYYQPAPVYYGRPDISIVFPIDLD